jgi:hypothetical protein
MRQVLIDRTSRIDAIDLWAISPAPSASRVLASDCSLDSGVVSLVSSSARVVYAALAGDLAVAAAKFGASALSGSTAMLTEAIQFTGAPKPPNLPFTIPGLIGGVNCHVRYC